MTTKQESDMTTKQESDMTTKQESEHVFPRLLLAHGRPPHPSESFIALAEWDLDVRESIKQMVPDLDHEMVLWHYNMWLVHEGKK